MARDADAERGVTNLVLIETTIIAAAAAGGAFTIYRPVYMSINQSITC